MTVLYEHPVDVKEVSRMMKEAILAAPISWEGVDLLECSRYVALNWTEDQCRKSKIGGSYLEGGLTMEPSPQ